MKNAQTVVIGGGPAGLTAAYELAKHGHSSVVLEQADRVGGISRTEDYKGYRFDIGGHRFFTKVGEVQQVWKEILGDEFIQVPRLSRIYYRGRFFDYPLSISNTLKNLGPVDSALIVLSYVKSRLKAKLNPGEEAENFEDWVVERFGNRLYRTFFKSYTEKVWGIPCDKIQAEWAAQRIKGLSLKKAVVNAMFGSNDTKTLIKEFDYPILGPGMMWERCQEILDRKGSPVHLHTRVEKIEHENGRVTKVTARKGDETLELEGDDYVSSMPVTALIRCLHPAPPAHVLKAARGLKYRDFLIVPIIVNLKSLFPDNWIYIHSPEFKVGRIQNFKNWSPKMVPDPEKTCLGMEYFCSEGDQLWEMSDSELVKLASREIVGLGLVPVQALVEDGTVIRQKKAYPVYDGEYRDHLQVMQDYIQSFQNLQTVGRNGMHRYNNQDHSMLTGLLAAKNILGEHHDLWNVNVERSYHEDFTKDQWAKLKAEKKRQEQTQAILA
ncbi:NAD(P)/FAD-dependent oxidoreductase [Romeria aff. gracilis LEGE 07310]|uniref:NAD(P)/FAD-dependent oxidoreductase n=1 Tax=Vasconcelosia minhoensis LEGE 07310 TaxID=915328 RepID=A0A8J7DDG1_9CYAN|nr:NAD(P)/FAD-dependent oxidoreductase [Romeria gracilis]MBE9078743.1 NAD(P)/FAD-dependent oxidoreductase [Romeria aff. gracilis LEGE 07310]